MENDKEVLKNGKEVSSNATYYWKDGNMHRDDGPAYIFGNYQAWYQKGNLHREDGPAQVWLLSSKKEERWWINGNNIDVKSQQEFEHWKKLKAFW